jgi:hypothetical protein
MVLACSAQHGNLNDLGCQLSLFKSQVQEILKERKLRKLTVLRLFTLVVLKMVSARLSKAKEKSGSKLPSVPFACSAKT